MILKEDGAYPGRVDSGVKGHSPRGRDGDSQDLARPPGRPVPSTPTRRKQGRVRPRLFHHLMSPSPTVGTNHRKRRENDCLCK